MGIESWLLSPPSFKIQDSRQKYSLVGGDKTCETTRISTKTHGVHERCSKWA